MDRVGLHIVGGRRMNLDGDPMSWSLNEACCTIDRMVTQLESDLALKIGRSGAIP